MNVQIHNDAKEGFPARNSLEKCFPRFSLQGREARVPVVGGAGLYLQLAAGTGFIVRVGFRREKMQEF